LSSLNDKIIVGGLFCDLNKACDCVNYDILPLKIKFYSIVGVVHKLMESYLRNSRVTISACNKINGYFSKWEEVQHGITQGAVLGPLLFLVYINDLSKGVSDKSSPILFADDTSFIIVNPNKDKFKFNTNDIFSKINGFAVVC